MPNTAAGNFWADAECVRQGADPELFFIPQGDTLATREVIARFCDRCVMRTQCAEVGAQHDASYGIWGGVRAPKHTRKSYVWPDSVGGAA